MANKKISQLTSAGSLANSDTFPIASSGSTKSVTASTIKTYITSNTSLLDFGVTDGTNGQVLTTDGSGNLSFTTISGSGPTNEITNTDGYSTYSVSVGTDGVVTMTTSRGGLEFGALPEVGGPTHFHVMKPAGQMTDLFFGDDYNYVRQRPAAYGSDPGYGVEIGANDLDGGGQHVWRFGTNGDLVLPAGKTIRDTSGTDLLADDDAGGDPAYKGFKAHYGRMWGNTDDPNGPINKIVIYKDSVSPSSSIDESTSNDTFNVTGLTGSDVVAMIVVVGQNVDQTSTAELKTFAESIIDTVILDGGVEGEVNSIQTIKDNFYNNYSTFSAVVTDRKTNLEFFSVNDQFNISPTFATGDGANFSGISYNMDNDTLDLGSWGQGAPNTHEVGDVHVIAGNTIQDGNGNFLLSPDNDVTVTITGVSDGWIQTVTVTGTLPRPQELWPSNYISDGGDDEYDTANYINTNNENEISYNDGNVVSGSSAFGGGDYVVAYQDGIFGIFAVNADIDSLGTSGNSGFDGDGQADTGSLYGGVAEDNTMADITFVGTALKTDNGSGPFYNGVISLMPGSLNETQYANYGQFINVYPTFDYDQPHIHIAAGEGSESTGDLILGPDSYHIDINHDGKVYIKTGNQNHTWTFDDNGVLTLPNGSTVSGNFYDLSNRPSGNTALLDLIGGSSSADNGKFYMQTVTGQAEWTSLLRTVPASSIGADGDLPGKMAADASYFYVCTAAYDGTTNIWKRIAWSGTTW